MLPVLWVEDQEQEVNWLAPILNKIPGIEVHLVFVGRKPLEEQTLKGFNVRPHPVPECQQDDVTLDCVADVLCSWYRRKQPWLVLMDLRLEPIDDDPKTTKLDEFRVPGVDLALRLYEELGAQNIVFLSRWGDRISDTLVDTMVQDNEETRCTVLRWPKTYFIDKEMLLDNNIIDMLKELTSGAIARLKSEGALELIPASRIQSLFRLISSHRDTLFHYVIDAYSQGDGKFSQEFLNFPLLEFHNPRLSVATWLWAQHGFTTRYNLDQLDNLSPRELTAKLEGLLADGLWGMRVDRFVEHLRDEITANPGPRTTTNPTLGSTLATLCTDERVIGPLAQAALWPAVRNAIENALQEGDTTIDCIPFANALYLFIRNTVSTSVGEVKREMIQKAESGVLHGVKQIRTAIYDLNKLHKGQLNLERAFGQWGFALLFDGELLGTYNPDAPEEDQFAFKAGTTMDEARSICCENGWGKDSIVAVFRLPLELPSRLGDPSLDPLGDRIQNQGARI